MKNSSLFKFLRKKIGRYSRRDFVLGKDNKLVIQVHNPIVQDKKKKHFFIRIISELATKEFQVFKCKDTLNPGEAESLRGIIKASKITESY